MIIAGNGHRPQKLQHNWGQYESITLPRLTALAAAYFTRTKPTQVITGMALGWDSAIAIAAIELGIPLLCAIPCKDYTTKWSLSCQNTHAWILSHADQVSECEAPYSRQQLFLRSKWMTDHCDKLVCLWNGEKSGGTWNCIKYARFINKPYDNVWDSWVKFKGF